MSGDCNSYFPIVHGKCRGCERMTPICTCGHCGSCHDKDKGNPDTDASMEVSKPEPIGGDH